MVNPEATDASWTTRLRRHWDRLHGIEILLLIVFFIDFKLSHAESPLTAVQTDIVTAALGFLSPNPLIVLIDERLWRLSPNKYLNGWTLALAYAFSVPISLWAMKEWARLPVEEPTSESKDAMQHFQFKKAMSRTLESPFYRVLYLFHHSFFCLDTFQRGRFLLGMLRDLSSTIMHASVVICVLPWDASEYTLAKRSAFLAVSNLGIVLAALLYRKFADTFTEILEEDAEKQPNLMETL